MISRIAALVCALTVSGFAQTSFVTPAAPGAAEVAARGALEIARTEHEVLLAWDLPAGEVRSDAAPADAPGAAGPLENRRDG